MRRDLSVCVGRRADGRRAGAGAEVTATRGVLHVLEGDVVCVSPPTCDSDVLQL